MWRQGKRGEVKKPVDAGAEIFFRCPKCASLFSTTKRILEQDKHTKSPLTRLLLGGRIAPMAYTPRCTACATRLERMTPEEFETEINRTHGSSSGK